MTNITTQQVQHLAHLSSLRLEADELDAITHDIDAILGYVEQLSDLDTENILPTYHLNNLANISRPDEVISSDITREQLLAQAPGGQKDGQVKVPKVL